MSNININYSQVQSTTAQVTKSAIGIKDISTLYQEIYATLAKSAGDGADRIKDHILEEQLLCERIAEFFQKMSTMIQDVSAEMEAHDLAKKEKQVVTGAGKSGRITGK